MPLIKKNNDIVMYASSRLQNDKDIIEECIKHYGTDIFKYTNDDIRNNRDIMFRAVQVTGFNINYASEELRNDEKLMKIALKTCSWAYQFAGPELKEKYPTVEKFIEATKEKVKPKETSKEKPTRSRLRSKGQERWFIADNLSAIIFL